MKHIDADAGRVRVPASRQIDLVSRANGRSYRLRIAWPRGAPPAGGWPALLVLDGDAYFGTMTDVMRNRGELAGEISPFVVVAVGYPDAAPDAWHTRRVLDYTPCAPEQGTLNGDTGGLETFLDTLEHELLPLVRGEFGTHPGRSALWGHSLGGLAVLAALLSRPGLVRSYLAVSPATWVAEQDLSRRLQGYAALAAVLQGPPRVHIAVGADEERLPRRRAADSPYTPEQVQAQIAMARMVGRAREWAARLRGLPASPPNVALDVIADESHVSVAYAALRPAFDLAFGPDQEGSPA